jgi:glycosyltransferase involved in cell wall biosynthesis
MPAAFLTCKTDICVPKPAPRERVEMRPLPRDPLVSVIVPSYNQGKFIRQTLESILSQDYRPIEILVIDGASQDETLDVLRSFTNEPDLKWISEPDRGVVEAVNKGFAKAGGDILAIQSSDDCYTAGAIATVVRELQAQPEVGLLYGDTVKIDEQGNELLQTRIGPYSLENLFLIKTWIPQPSAFFRRELLETLGGWDDRIPFAPDTDLWIRMAFRTDVCKLDACLSQRRVHGAQRDVQARKIVRDYSRMIEQSPDIRQASARLRRAAHAGKYLMRVRYNPYDSDWYAAWNLMRAARLDPTCLNLREIARRLFVQPIRRRLSGIKQFCLRMVARAGVRPVV